MREEERRQRGLSALALLAWGKPHATPAGVGLAVALGALASGYSLRYVALPHLTAMRAAVVQLAVPVVPVVAALGGVLLLGESLTARLVGAGLSAGGGRVADAARPPAQGSHAGPVGVGCPPCANPSWWRSSTWTTKIGHRFGGVFLT